MTLDEASRPAALKPGGARPAIELVSVIIVAGIAAARPDAACRIVVSRGGAVEVAGEGFVVAARLS